MNSSSVTRSFPLKTDFCDADRVSARMCHADGIAFTPAGNPRFFTRTLGLDEASHGGPWDRAASRGDFPFCRRHLGDPAGRRSSGVSSGAQAGPGCRCGGCVPSSRLVIQAVGSAATQGGRDSGAERVVT